MFEYRALLKRVVDGDTIDVYLDLGFCITVEQRLRLADIDTPEMNSKDNVERENALAAKDFVEKTIGNQPLIVITHKTKAGKERVTFGRYVADVYIVQANEVGTLFLNKAIVDAGYGKIV